MKIVITGCAGWIGRKLTDQLLKHDSEILGIDNLYVGLPKPKQHKNLKFYEKDIRDDSMFNIINDFKPNIVYHLAAVHHIPTCEKDPQFAFDVNIKGTQNILEASRISDKLILMSSGAVYDWTKEALNVNNKIAPKDIYSISKATNENQVRYWSRLNNKKATIIRLFNTIGLNDPNAHLIPDILGQIDFDKNDNSIQLGNIIPKRDYIYIDDVVDILSKVAFKDNKEEISTFNVGTGKEYSVEDIVKIIGKLLKINIDIKVDNKRIRKNDRISQLADIYLTKKNFNWSPKYNLEQSLKIIVEAFTKK